MDLEWTTELTEVCAALTVPASDKLAVEHAAKRVGVAVASVSFPDNSRGQWQALVEAAMAQDKLFDLLRDLRGMFPELAAALDPALMRYEPNFNRVAVACRGLQQYLETLRTPDDVDEAELGDMSADARALFDLDDRWNAFLRRPLDSTGQDLRSARRARRLFRSRLDSYLVGLHVYRDVIRRRDAVEPFGAGGLQAIGEAGAQAKMKLLRAVEAMVNLPEEVE